MAKHNELGVRGEEIAVRYLMSKSYSILERNWRYGRLEVDIISRHNDELVMIEVKTRSGSFVESLGEAVDKRKQELLIRAANAYILKSILNLEIRFDIISVIFLNNAEYRVCHLENAFYPRVRS